jgi:hypothetical protein
MEVTNNPKYTQEVIDDPEYFLISNRGHSFSFDKVWDTPTGYENELQRIGIVGSCTGVNSISSGPSKSYKNTAFFATAGTGKGAYNNKITLSVIDSLEKGTTNYVEMWDDAKQKIGKEGDAAYYVGPDTFFVDELNAAPTAAAPTASPVVADGG